MCSDPVGGNGICVRYYSVAHVVIFGGSLYPSFAADQFSGARHIRQNSVSVMKYHSRAHV